jgi:hypothetical protein
VRLEWKSHPSRQISIAGPRLREEKDGPITIGLSQNSGWIKTKKTCLRLGDVKTRLGDINTRRRPIKTKKTCLRLGDVKTRLGDVNTRRRPIKCHPGNKIYQGKLK